MSTYVCQHMYDSSLTWLISHMGLWLIKHMRRVYKESSLLRKSFYSCLLIQITIEDT